jgi:hypothetical protein
MVVSLLSHFLDVVRHPASVDGALLRPVDPSRDDQGGANWRSTSYEVTAQGVWPWVKPQARISLWP